MANELLSIQETLQRFSVNREIRDAAIRHAIYIERLKSHEVNKIIGFMNTEVFPDALDKLQSRLNRITERGYDLGPATTKRLKETTTAVGEMIDKGLVVSRDKLNKDLLAIAGNELNWQVGALKSATKGMLNYSFTVPSDAKLKSIITSRPMEGVLLKDWWSRMRGWQKRELSSQIMKGYALGESVPNIVRRVRGTKAANYGDGMLGKLRHRAASTVRTSISHVNSHASEMTYEKNNAVLKGVQYLATLDAKTSDICMSLDGREFKINEGPIPPMHHQCRSKRIPVVKSWEELRIDLKKKPASTRAAREYNAEGKAMFTKQVSEKITYPQWLKSQPVPVQNEALGVTRATAFRKGQITIDKFTDNKYRTLTLPELRKKEGLTLKIPRKKKVKQNV